MNFKPTIWKIIGSVAVGFAIGYLSLSSFILTVKPGGLGASEYTYNWSSILITGVVTFVVIYIIWSLFQKKQNS